MKNQFLFLGTGASAGIPVIGCQCAVCQSPDVHNKRLRPSGLVTTQGKTLLIDTSPDLRCQALRHQLRHLDGVLLTHTHYDHIAGIDELRTFYLIERKPLPVLVSNATYQELKKRYDYLFRERSLSKSLTAQLSFQQLEGRRGQTQFLGISIGYTSYEQGGMEVNGFRFGDFAYIADIRQYDETIFEDLKGIKYLVISCLKRESSYMHFSIEECIEFARKLKVEQTWFTHISHEMEHESINRTLPSGFQLSYDGLIIEF